MKVLQLEKGTIVIGCDPELMIQNSKGVLISATEILTGTKEKPQEVKMGAILSDNVNLEFNTKPAKTSQEFIDTIEIVLNESLKLVGKDNKLVVLASANFPKEALKDPKTQEFGCEPDYDAWRVAINQVAGDAASKNFRSAGGHIHVGMTSKSKKLLDNNVGKMRVVKTMDLILGTLSVILDKDPSSIPRRGLYGKAGSHRPKPYGVEYRSLGPFWVKAKELVQLMHSLTSISVQICLKNLDEELIKTAGEKKIIETINNSDLTGAREIFSLIHENILQPSLLADIKRLENKEYDFYQEWNLGS